MAERLHGKRGQMPDVRAAIDNSIRLLTADSWPDARIMDWLEGARFVVQFLAAQKARQAAESIEEGTGKRFPKIMLDKRFGTALE